MKRPALVQHGTRAGFFMVFRYGDHSERGLETVKGSVRVFKRMIDKVQTRESAGFVQRFFRF